MCLQCNHEEDNTRLLLHAKASYGEGKDLIVLVCEDTDVFTLQELFPLHGSDVSVSSYLFSNNTAA